jgi:hypothetical protein
MQAHLSPRLRGENCFTRSKRTKLQLQPPLPNCAHKKTQHLSILRHPSRSRRPPLCSPARCSPCPSLCSCALRGWPLVAIAAARLSLVPYKWKPPPRSRLAPVHLPRREPTEQFSRPLAPSSARTARVPTSARALVWLDGLSAWRSGQPASAPAQIVALFGRRVAIVLGCSQAPMKKNCHRAPIDVAPRVRAVHVRT